MAFAAPAFLSNLVHAPAMNVVPTIYSTDFGLSLALVGTALFISRSADVVLDPLIGYLSDRTGGRLGARKPWVIAGALLTMVSTWFLFAPPPHPGFIYFLVWYALIYMGWSLIEVPHLAWGLELSRETSVRSRVLTFRGLAMGIAALGYVVLPLLPIFKTTAVTGETLRVMAWVVVAATPLCMVAALWAPAGVPVRREDHYNLKDLLSIVRGNPPLWMFLGGFVLWGLSTGMFGTLTFLYLSTYLGLAKQFVFIFGFLTICQLASLPLAPWIIRKLGNREVWAGSMVLGVMSFVLILLLPKGSAAVVPMLALCVPIGVSNALTLIGYTSVLGDVIDYDTWRTGKKRAAVYSGLLTFVQKVNVIPGGAIALIIVGLVGYQPKLGAANTPHAILGLKLAYVVAPIVLFGLSALFAGLSPINRRRQGIIARRLGQREARADRAVKTALSPALQVLPLQTAGG
ncbi:MAG TPA: MFS transporter [Phenylobacterium sp.]|jgi:Na+/melibiose symporter-like transporter|uniref:MFS transporter n=1 Tax=Phenylobacterium sp. TaxID=1871053 RepID=UPI002D4C96F0|nr:MFS transporter [Phenylobacterium sp.]HZZ69769.1 MFS transporter [Phenylobacterium sp.]